MTRLTTLRTASAGLTLGLLLACSSSSTVEEPGDSEDQVDEVDDGDDGDDGQVDPSVTALRDALEDEGLGTWPDPPTVRDELFELGQALFFDKLLSGNSDVSCATCHVPDIGVADGRTLPSGVGGTGLGTNRSGGEVIPRNSPTVLGTHMLTKLFWDGRVERLGNGNLRTPAGNDLTAGQEAVFESGLEILAAQAMFPPTSASEMRGAPGSNELADLADDDLQGIWSGLMDRLLDIAAYRDLFTAAYPSTAIGDLHFVHAANALAGFQAVAFGALDMPLADFAAGDDDALTAQQIQGGLAYFDEAGCVRCHSGPAFSDEGFHAIALPQFGPGKGDGTGGDDDFGREGVTGSANHRYRFKTPHLIGVELTAPYGHAGQYATLEGIVQHYRNPTQRLLGYDIASEVDDSSLIPTLVDNEDELIDALDQGLRNPRNFDVDEVAAFLRALTPESARDLSSVVPSSVPSGLPLD